MRKYKSFAYSDKALLIAFSASGIVEAVNAFLKYDREVTRSMYLNEIAQTQLLAGLKRE